MFYGADQSTITNISKKILNVTKLNITDGTTPTPITSSVLHKEMISSAALGATISTAIVTAASGRTSQNYLAGVNFVESIYGASYKLRVQDYNGISPIPGDLELEADVVTITAASTINLSGAGTFINIGNKTINTNSSQFKLSTFTGTEMEILCKDGSNSANYANFTMTNATAFKINLSASSPASVLTVTASGTTGQTLTSTGTITINANTTFTSGRTVTFSGCTLVGLPAATAHASTHQSVESEDSNGTPSLADNLSAWMVGAVARATPVLLNKIAIAKTDGFYDQPVAFNDNQLYGASGGGASAYSTLFSAGNTNHGPMYVVLAAADGATVAAETTAKGPPGQIIMIRKV